jgi:peptide/nickel transport system ATP-binding protein
MTTAAFGTTTSNARSDASPLLAVEGLTVSFRTPHGSVTVVEDVSFDVPPGRTMGLVGESGSGKTVSSLSILQLLPRSATIDGSIRFDGRELLGMSVEDLRAVRGNEISMIFQEPMTSLDPAFKVGDQIAEVVRRHRGVSRSQAWKRAAEMLDVVGIPEARRRVHDYPHHFSGGMRQRAMIAMALACDPKLLIADEPTTALDVTIQSQILELLRSLQEQFGMAMIFVTHDLGVVANICDRVTVMYAGQVVEEGDVDGIFLQPRHPYSAGLLASMPQSVQRGERLRVIPGTVPRPEQMPVGCRFHPRCPHAIGPCEATAPPLARVPDRLVRCIRQEELTLEGAE